MFPVSLYFLYAFVFPQTLTSTQLCLLCNTCQVEWTKLLSYTPETVFYLRTCLGSNFIVNIKLSFKMRVFYLCQSSQFLKDQFSKLGYSKLGRMLIPKTDFKTVLTSHWWESAKAISPSRLNHWPATSVELLLCVRTGADTLRLAVKMSLPSWAGHPGCETDSWRVSKILSNSDCVRRPGCCSKYSQGRYMKRGLWSNIENDTKQWIIRRPQPQHGRQQGQHV